MRTVNLSLAYCSTQFQLRSLRPISTYRWTSPRVLKDNTYTLTLRTCDTGKNTMSLPKLHICLNPRVLTAPSRRLAK